MTPPDFRRLFESLPGLFLVLDRELHIVAVTDAYARATMTQRDAIVGRHLFEVFPDNPDDDGATGVANLRASIERVLATGRPDSMGVQKYDIRRPDDAGGGFEERFWSPMNSPLLGADGSVELIIHRAEDVTDFVRLERDRSLQTEQLQSSVRAMEVEIFHRSREIHEANQALRASQADLELKVRERTARLEEKNAALEREIAERERAEEALSRSEEQLRQAQKMEAVGRLAGGVAHDFNNLLSVILGYSALLLTTATTGREELDEISKAGERAAGLTRQLLAFSRQQVLEPAILDATEVVERLDKMLRRLIGEDVDLRLALAKRLGRVRADRGQLEQVLLNLVVNARDAMPLGGVLTLETADASLTEDYVAAHVGVSPGRYVMIAVSDTGVGMDEATRSRAFEPFFTTKERGKGTGLGLSTAFGIVKQSGGHIWLYSEPGQGTTVKVYLPVASDVAMAVPTLPPPAPDPRGDETILLVEDEEQVRAVATEMLRRAGYRVVTARSPAQAIAISEAPDTAIDALLTDVIMPGMNGAELARRIGERHPHLRVVFMSGYTDDVILHHGVLEAGVSFVQKPLRPDTLLAKLRAALDAPR